jgi:hypothetical protein
MFFVLFASLFFVITIEASACYRSSCFLSSHLPCSQRDCIAEFKADDCVMWRRSNLVYCFENKAEDLTYCAAKCSPFELTSEMFYKCDGISDALCGMPHQAPFLTCIC